ncbi:MAG: peptidylprolyl isomerase [Chloroflexota bacterium]|nr:peptidylprolyl isomerase [Chloroflexota bacterium]
MQIDPQRQYFATLRTEKGDVRIKLFADKAPKTVNNFVFLARQGFYDEITFHRVIPGFMAQTGDPTGTGGGGPGYAIEDEFSSNLKHDRLGRVSMANKGQPNTGGSQFFITYAPAPHLDGHHTIFGQVVRGMDALEQLTERRPSKNPDAPPGDKLLSVEIEEK